MKEMVMRDVNEREADLVQGIVLYLLLGPTVLREVECIDAFRSIQLVDVIPGQSSSEFIVCLRS